MIPYILLGAALQYLSSKLFPWLGEKVGKYLYHKKMNEEKALSLQKPEVQGPKSNTYTPKFAGNPYNTFYSSGLKI